MVRVDGVEIQALEEGDMDRFRGQNFGFVFQTFNLLKPFTALQNVLLGMQFSDTQPQKIWKSRAVNRYQFPVTKSGPGSPGHDRREAT